MAMIRWFNVETVKTPSKESPPPDSLVVASDGYVMEKDDIPFYQIFGYESYIEIYDIFSNYFLVRQHAYDKRTRTSTLHAEYRLTLTDDARKVVDELLNAPFFECNVKHNIRYLRYDCLAVYPVHIPEPDTGRNLQGQWDITIYEYDEKVYVRMATTIPFNCGPLRPLWKKAVECWVNEIATKKINPKHIDIEAIRNKLLKYQYLRIAIVPIYYIH